MTFGLSTIGNQHDLYRVIEQQEQPVKFLDYSHVGTQYSFFIELHPGLNLQKQPNLELLENLVLPNFYPPNEILTKGWLAGRYIFEKNWSQILKNLSLHDWDNEDIFLLVKNIETKDIQNCQYSMNYVKKKIPKTIINQLVSSYFCHLWNSVVVQRLETLGLKPLLGDLMYGKFGSLESVSTANLKDVDLKRIAMLVPGGITTCYPDNLLIKNIYQSLIPRFGDKWFRSRAKEFFSGESYRPMLCHLIDFEYNWISNGKFSLKFKLPAMTSYENALRGLRTCLDCFQISSSSTSLSSVYPQPRSGEQTSFNINPTRLAQQTAENSISNDLKKRKNANEGKEKQTRKQKVQPGKDMTKEKEQRKNLLENPKELDKKTNSPAAKEKFLVPKCEKVRATDGFENSTVSGFSADSTASETRYSELRASKRSSVDVKIPLPNSKGASKIIEVITIDDSSDSEKEPAKKKPYYLRSSVRSVALTPPSNTMFTFIKSEKGLNQDCKKSNSKADLIETVMRVKLESNQTQKTSPENVCPVEVKIEQPGETNFQSQNLRNSKVKQEIMDAELKPYRTSATVKEY